MKFFHHRHEGEEFLGFINYQTCYGWRGVALNFKIFRIYVRYGKVFSDKDKLEIFIRFSR